MHKIHRDHWDDDDHGPTQVKMRNTRNYMTKHNHLDTSWIRLVLRGSVGKLWDQVYSDLCQRFNTTGNAWIYKAELRWWVSLSSWIEAGYVYTSDFRNFYVDPNGILRKGRHWRYVAYRDTTPKTEIVLEYFDDVVKTKWGRSEIKHSLNLVDGIWYRQLWRKFLYSRRVSDPESPTGTKLVWETRKVCAKKQLSKRELLEHGLRNVPEIKPISNKYLKSLL